MLRKILAFLWIAHLTFAEPTGHHPSNLIEECVDVISGNCMIFAQDMEIRGAEPIYINRVYTQKTGDWTFIPHLRLTRKKPEDEPSYIEFYEPDGTKVYFGVPKEVKEPVIELSLDLASTYSERAYSQRHTISGNSNIKNIQAKMSKDKSDIYIKSTNGCWRYYKRNKNTRNKRNVGYTLCWEELPNGNRLGYYYLGNGRILIQAFNPKNNKVFTESKQKYLCLDEDIPNFILNTSDAQQATYLYEHHKEKKSGYKNTLELIKHLEKPEERYTYIPTANGKKWLIESRTYANKQCLFFEYYKRGKNKTRWHRCDCKNKDDFRIDRVKEIHSDGKLIYTFEYGDANKDSRFTKVWDAEGNLTIYHYNALHQITQIKRHDLHGHLINIEIYAYGEKENKNELIAATLLDQNEQPLTSTTYDYDTWGNIIEETHWGEITGWSPFKLKLNDQNIPIQNGVETSTKKFRYTQDGRNLLIYEKEENGLETYYNYPPTGNLITSKFIKSDGRIIRRTFYKYKDNLLYKEIKDDGSSEDRKSLQDVTERHILKTSPYSRGPFIGMPEWIEESYLDLQTREEVLVLKTNLTYYPNRKVHKKHVYNSENLLAYTQSYEYDHRNNLITETDPLGRKSTMTYNDLLKKATVVDFDEILTHTFEYGTNGQLIKITHADKDQNSKTEQYDYNSKAQCIKKTDWYHNDTTFLYDMLGNLTETKLPDGTIRKTRYNALSQPISQIDGEGYETKIRPNIHSKPIEITYPDGTKENYRYYLDGNLSETIETGGATTKYKYDHFNRIIETEVFISNKLYSKESSIYSTLHLNQKIDPIGQKINYEYDGAGRKILETDGTLTTHFGYDTLNRPAITKTDAGTKTTHFDLLDRPIEETIHDTTGDLISRLNYTYDSFGNKTSTTRSIEAELATETTDYDSFCRPIRQKDAMGNIQTTRYNDQYENINGYLTLCKTETSANNNQTITYYDILGRVETQEVRDPTGCQLTHRSYRYDHNDNCITQIDTFAEKELITQRSYTRTNKIEKLTEASKKATTYTYDQCGRLETQTAPNGTTITYSYTPLNQIKTLTTAHASYQYHYDLLGRIEKVEDLIHHTTTYRSYDRQGNLEQETLGNGLTLTSIYDTQSRRKELTLPDETTIQYDYSPYHLSSITRNNHHTSYTHQLLKYDLSSNLLEETNATHHYNLNGQKDQIDTPIFTQAITERDPLGNILTQVTNTSAESFTYSPLSQLTSEANHTYTYDTLHNRTSKNSHPYTYNLTQLKSTPTATFDYDKAGYPIQKTATDTINYIYDGLGRLIEANSNRWRLTFIYDSFNRCLCRTLYHNNIQLKHQNFLYDDNCEIGSTDQNHQIQELRILKNTTQAEIGAAIALELQDTIYIPIHDLYGNVCALLDENGNLAEATQYTAFGEYTPFNLNPWGFRSKRYDPELQLIHFGRRYYDPTTGRFLTPDPKGFIDGLNLYAYCLNNPLNAIDLFGEQINIEFSVDFSTVASIASTAASIIGTTIYHTFNHGMPVPGVRQAGMALGNALSRNWDRPFKTDPSSYNTPQSRNREDAAFLSINGILNYKPDAKETATYLSRCLNGLQVDYYHSTTRGFITDILTAFIGKLGVQTSDSIEISMIMRRQIAFLKYATDTPQLFVFAHSRGGVYLDNALKLMTPEERKLIHAYTFGSASLFPNTGLSSLKHYVATGDPVPMTDPLNYLKGRFSSSSNVHFLPGQGNFFTRHMVLEKTYADGIEEITHNILKMIGE